MEALQQLKAYYEQGYIGQEEYNKTRLEIIDAVQRGMKVRGPFRTPRRIDPRDAAGGASQHGAR